MRHILFLIAFIFSFSVLADGGPTGNNTIGQQGSGNGSGGLNPVPINLPPPPGTISPIKIDGPKTNFSSNVKQYREGHYLYTRIPMRDWILSDKRKEGYEVSQVFAQRLLRAWLAKAIGLQLPDATKLGNLEEKSAEELDKMIQDQKIKGHMPTAAELVAMTQNATAKATVDKLKDRANFMISLDDLTAAFNKSLNDALEQQYSSNTLGEKAVETAKAFAPSALVGVIGFKLPPAALAWLRDIPVAKALAPFLTGTIMGTVSMRPTLVTKMDLDTGKVVADEWHIESATQFWVLKDIVKGKATLATAEFQWGFGFLNGDYTEMSDVSGALIGGSTFFRSTAPDEKGIIAKTYNVKYGVLTNLTKTFTGVVDLRDFIKNGYVFVTRQTGVAALPNNRRSVVEAGYAANLQGFFDTITVDQQTIADLTKEIIATNPGATVDVKNNQLRVVIPNKTSVPLNMNTTPLNQQNSSGQADGHDGEKKPL